MLEGAHDYTSFCHQSEHGRDNVLRVDSISLTVLQEEVWLPHSSAAAPLPPRPVGGSAAAAASVSSAPPMLRIALDFVACSFRMHMVRNLVGAIVDIGRGKLSTADIEPIFAARSRARAGEVSVAWRATAWGPASCGCGCGGSPKVCS